MSDQINPAWEKASHHVIFLSDFLPGGAYDGLTIQQAVEKLNMSDQQKQDDSGGQNPIWPGETPKAPAPGTVTTDPKTGETIIVPLVR